MNSNSYTCYSRQTDAISYQPFQLHCLWMNTLVQYKFGNVAPVKLTNLSALFTDY